MRRAGLSYRLARIPGAALLLAILALPAMPIGLLCLWLVADAAGADAGRLDMLESLLVDDLKTGGTPALRSRLDRLGEAQTVGVADRQVSAALWRRGDLVAAVGPLAPGSLLSAPAGPGGDRRVLAPDLARVTSDWDLPVADLELRLAAPRPGPAEISARSVAGTAVGVYAFAALLGAALQWHHRLRYRDGLRAMNRRLDAFAGGDTAARLDADQPAPELVRLADLINPALDRIARDVADLRDFSALAAHEMRTPIQIARQEIEALRRDEVADPAEGLARVEARLYESLGAFDAVMTLIRLLASRDAPAPARTVDLGDRVEWALDSLGDRLESEERTLTAEIATDVAVAADPAQIDRLIFNLLDNAAKYAPKGAEIRASLAAADSRFRLAVANTGGGFPADIRDRAFDRFARARAVRPEAGLGLGLGLVRAIAERHGFEFEITPSDEIAEVVVRGPCKGSSP